MTHHLDDITSSGGNSGVLYLVHIVDDAVEGGIDSGDVFLLPIIDVSYGWSENVQFAVVATRIVNDPDGEEEKSDFGPAAVGVKWRFLDQDALQMSVAPFYEFIPRDGAADREVIDDLDAWGLPVQFQ